MGVRGVSLLAREIAESNKARNNVLIFIEGLGPMMRRVVCSLCYELRSLDDRMLVAEAC